jgi:FkbM family methyltransferase
VPTEIINGIKISFSGNEYGVIPEVYFEDPYRVDEIKHGSVVIDIGACIGVFSLRCAKEKDCTVYAYEPYIGNYNLLIDNIRDNKLEDKIIPFNSAIVGKIEDKEETVGKIEDKEETEETRDFYIHPNHFAGCTLYPGDGIPYTKVKVECITLAQIFIDNNLNKCDILKMDCEGEEKYILSSTDIETLKKIDKVILEYHLYVDGRDISEYLRKVGFSIYPEELPNVERSILYANR